MARWPRATFHESLNLAALWGLPVLFVCENNRYAMGTALELSESETDIHKKAESYRIASEAVDGMDVVAVEAAAQARRSPRCAKTGKPYFLECRTYRFRAHSMFDAQLYREKAEVEAWRAKGPIVRFQDWAEQNGLVHPDDVDRIHAAVAAEIDAAVSFAEAGTWEPVEDLTRYVYAPERPAPPAARPAGAATANGRRPPTARPCGKRSATRCSATSESSSWARTSAATAAAMRSARACWPSSGPSASATRRFPKPASPARASARPWPACARSSR